MRAISDPNRDLTRRQKKSFRVGILPSLLILFAFENIGCSSAKPPTGILSQAELDVRAASEARADELAPMDLQSAREKLEASKQAMAAKKYDDARRLAETAQVEAELASGQGRSGNYPPDGGRSAAPARPVSVRKRTRYRAAIITRLHQGVVYEAQRLSRSQVPWRGALIAGDFIVGLRRRKQSSVAAGARRLRSRAARPRTSQTRRSSTG